MIGRARAGLLLVSALASTSNAGETGSRRGPIEGHDEWLLAEPRLTIAPGGPDAVGRGRTRVRVAFDWGNDFGWRQDFSGEQPGDRRFLVDGEHRTLDLDVRHGLGDDVDLDLRVPVRWRGPGMLDGLIDGFHRFTRHLGLPENGRPSFLRDRLRVLGRDDAFRPVAWSGRGGTGLGNVEVGARWRFRALASRGWTAAAVGRVGLPTASGAFAAGGVDLGAQVMAARSLGRSIDLYMGAGGTRFGDRRIEGISSPRWRVHGFAVFEWRPGPSWSLLVQGDAASRLVTSFADYPSLQSYLRIGAKVDLGQPWVLEGGFTENLSDQQATTDFGVFVGLSRRF